MGTPAGPGNRAAAFAARWDLPLRTVESGPGALAALRTILEGLLSVDPGRARWALRSLPYMRDRFTLADLLLLAGRWTDELAERVLDRAADAGGGL